MANTHTTRRAHRNNMPTCALLDEIATLEAQRSAHGSAQRNPASYLAGSHLHAQAVRARRLRTRLANLRAEARRRGLTL